VGKLARKLNARRHRKELGEDVLIDRIQPVIPPRGEDLRFKMDVIPLETPDEVKMLDVEPIRNRHFQVCMVDGQTHGLENGLTRFQQVVYPPCTPG
jgi:hypothetical protein